MCNVHYKYEVFLFFSSLFTKNLGNCGQHSLYTTWRPKFWRCDFVCVRWYEWCSEDISSAFHQPILNHISRIFAENPLLYSMLKTTFSTFKMCDYLNKVKVNCNNILVLLTRIKMNYGKRGVQKVCGPTMKEHRYQSHCISVSELGHKLFEHRSYILISSCTPRSKIKH